MGAAHDTALLIPPTAPAVLCVFHEGRRVSLARVSLTPPACTAGHGCSLIVAPAQSPSRLLFGQAWCAQTLGLVRELHAVRACSGFPLQQYNVMRFR